MEVEGNQGSGPSPWPWLEGLPRCEHRVIQGAECSFQEPPARLLLRGRCSHLVRQQRVDAEPPRVLLFRILQPHLPGCSRLQVLHP